MPLLLVSSTRDHTVEPRNTDAIAELVGSPDVRRVTCERSFHVPQLDWDRDLVETAVLDFVIDVHERA